MKNLVSSVFKVWFQNSFPDKIIRLAISIFIFFSLTCFYSCLGIAAERPDKRISPQIVKQSPKKPAVKKTSRITAEAKAKFPDRAFSFPSRMRVNRFYLADNIFLTKKGWLSLFLSRETKENDETFSEIGGGFFREIGLISPFQKIKEGFYLAIYGQRASNHFDSSETFFISGAYGMRSGHANESFEHKTNLAAVELRAVTKLIEIPMGNFQLLGLIDGGPSWMAKDRWRTAEDKSLDLPGIGIGLNWGIPHVSVRTSYVWKPESEKEIPDRGRFWLQGVIRF
jgi:hypothetical protein